MAPKSTARKTGSSRSRRKRATATTQPFGDTYKPIAWENASTLTADDPTSCTQPPASCSCGGSNAANVLHWIREARDEVRHARRAIAANWMSTENEALSWAEQFLDNALSGRPKVQ